MKLERIFRGLSSAWLCWAAVALVASCGGRSVPNGTDSSSHWLASCDRDDDCSNGYECLCGVCTRDCSEANDCRDLTGGAICEAVPGCAGPNVCITEAKLSNISTCQGEECDPSPTTEPSSGTTTTVSASSTATDSSTGMDSVGPSGDACDTLLMAETNTAEPCRESASRCEQFKTENKQRTVLFVLDESGDTPSGEEVRYTDEEFAWRRQCVLDWAEARGLAVEASETDVEITAAWADVEPIASSDVFIGYELRCDDCDYCHALDQSGCADDNFCRVYTGRVVDQTRQCLEPSAMFECIPADEGCDTAFAFGVDDFGVCWLFSEGCRTERSFEYSLGECGPWNEIYAEQYAEETSCETGAECYSPFQNVDTARDEGSVGCECETNGDEVCNGDTLFICEGGRWSAGWDGICFVEYGRCDRVFDSMAECLAADFDCILGPDAETDPVCGVQWKSAERPLFDAEQCEAMGGTVIEGDNDVWVRLPEALQACEVSSRGITEESCQAVGGYAWCSEANEAIYCQNAETPITEISNCAEETTGYCCVPDASE